MAAVAAAVRPEWFAFETLQVAVELRGELTRGLTVVELDRFFNAVPGASPLTVAVDHDAAAVLELFRTAVLENGWAA